VSEPGISPANSSICEDIAREHDRDRWLAALFAPEPARRHLHALIAFDHEMRILRSRVRAPIAGEIRLVWWREALTGLRDDEARGHPVAAGLLDAIKTFGLPLNLLENAVAARQFDLYDDPMPSLNDLEGYCGEICSSWFQLGALILAAGRDVGAADASGHAGVAYAVTQLLRGLPASAARGQVYPPRDLLQKHGVSPEDLLARRAGAGLAAALRELGAVARRHLAEAETRLAELPTEITPAYAPLAVVPLYLAKLERSADAPFGAEVEVAPWRRQWALWRWARRR
jgi:phytoene synthase